MTLMLRYDATTEPTTCLLTYGNFSRCLLLHLVVFMWRKILKDVVPVAQLFKHRINVSQSFFHLSRFISFGFYKFGSPKSQNGKQTKESVEAEQDLQNLLSQALAIYGMKAWARDIHCCQPWDPLHQTGFALAAELESPRNMIFFLVVLINNQKYIYYLAVRKNLQGNMQFSWQFSYAAK